MLRARAWKHRDQPFVCAFCRHKLLPAGERQLNRGFSSWNRSTVRLGASEASRSRICSNLPPRNARSLSTTAQLYNSSENNGPPRPGGFPGGFAGGFSGAGGASTLGSLAKRSSNTLLPHEQEARQQTNAAPPPPPPKPMTAPKTQNRPSHASGNKNQRRPSEAQSSSSRSVLADIFKTNREPRPPPTPKAWSSGHGEAPAKSPKGMDSFVPAKEAETKSATEAAPASAPRPTGWGAFSSRKVQTGDRAATPTRLSDIARLRRGGPAEKPAQKAAQKSAGRFGAKRNDVAEDDFWGELESRVSSKFADRNQSRREAGPGGSAGKRFGGSSGQQAAVDLSEYASGGLTGMTPQGSANDGRAPMDDRRKSRFELDEEPAGDRWAKKSKKNQKGRRGQELENEDDWDEEAIERWEQRERRKADREAQKLEAEEKANQPTPIFVPEYISVYNLARALKQQPEKFLVDMEEMGFENTTNDTIMTGDTAALVAMEYGFEPTVDSGSLRDLRPRPVPEDVSALPSRPPVVTIMGHVDHGKTTLLDWLRKSSVAAQEHGGITQHIGAFVVKMSSGKPITFLDTPGHAAFLSMRQRGANVTDIVVLVVAADDSVMPQTLEAIKHARAANVPMIVAISKIDKEQARVEQVKADLSRHGVEIEDYGGDVQVVGVSGKTGQGMGDLEENIVTLSEMLDVRAEEDGMAEGWILESSVKQDGKVATVLVKRGTVRPGDFIVAGKTWARIRVLRNEAGVELEEALPGTPVEILGWRELPTAGEQVLQSPDENKAKMAVDYRQEMAEREESSAELAEQEQRQRDKAAADAAAEAAAEDGTDQDGAAVTAEPGIIYQNFVIKADVAGSVEAVSSSILELGNHEVQSRVLRSSAGQISEWDIDHASASKSIVINFNTTIPPHIKGRAESAGVRILDYSVIYHLVDAAKGALQELLPESVSVRVLAEADVVQVFGINIRKRVIKNIAGCRVRNGSIKKMARVKVLRKGKVVFDGKIDTLKHVKKDVQEMGKGSECGIGFDGFEDLEMDDQIQTYEEVREKRYL